MPARHLALVLTTALLLIACGPDESGGSGSDPERNGATATTEAPPETTTTAGVGTTEAEAAPTTIPESDLPGVPFDLFPYEGAMMAVVGVEDGDVLFVRAGPGSSFEEIAALDPLTDGIRAHGDNRQLDDGTIWALVDVGTATGWANIRYLLQPGVVTDITAELGDVAAAPSMDELGRTVAESRGSVEPRSQIVIVARPEPGDLHEIIVDVIGFGDDAVGGERLHVFATAEDGSFRPKSIEATVLCSRGVDEDGLCR